MAIIAWNYKELNVSDEQIYSFSNWSASTTYKTEEKKNGKDMPKSTPVSPGRGKVSFDVQLSYRMGIRVEEEYYWWRDECMKGTESLLYFSYRQYGPYKWRLVGVDQADLKTLGNGSWISCRMTLTFEESYYKAKLTKLERKAKRLAKKLERQTNRAIRAKSDKAREKAIARAAETRKKLVRVQVGAALVRTSKVRKDRETRKSVIDAIAKRSSG